MIQKVYEIKQQKDYILWKITSTRISVAEAQEIGKELLMKINVGKMKKLVVDNLELDGVFSNDVQHVWSNIMHELNGRIDKCVTICKSPITKMQINRLSKEAGTHAKIIAVSSEKEAIDFLG